MSEYSRRNFIKTTAIGGLSLMGAASLSEGFALDLPTASSDLYILSQRLVQQWGDALLALQVMDTSRMLDYGGIYCTADQTVHGRVGDTIYPLFYLADKTKNSKYSDAAHLLYEWIERRVSQTDGSWFHPLRWLKL